MLRAAAAADLGFHGHQHFDSPTFSSASPTFIWYLSRCVASQREREDPPACGPLQALAPALARRPRKQRTPAAQRSAMRQREAAGPHIGFRCIVSALVVRIGAAHGLLGGNSGTRIAPPRCRNRAGLARSPWPAPPWRQRLRRGRCRMSWAGPRASSYSRSRDAPLSCTPRLCAGSPCFFARYRLQLIYNSPPSVEVRDLSMWLVAEGWPLRVDRECNALSLRAPDADMRGLRLRSVLGRRCRLRG